MSTEHQAREAVDCYYLGPDVWLTSVGRHVVFLDLTTQQYVGLDCTSQPSLLRALTCAMAHSQRRLLIDDVSAEEIQVLSQLSSRGLVTTTPGPDRQIYASPVSPTRSLVSIPNWRPEPLSFLAVVRFLLSYVDVRVRLKLQGLPSLVSRLRAGAPAAGYELSATDKERVGAVVRQFCRIRPWLYTAHQRCLEDSLILAEFLRSHGYPASLVIAIHPMPFSAHAWVQLGDCVIDDPVEAVKMYSPILVA